MIDIDVIGQLLPNPVTMLVRLVLHAGAVSGDQEISVEKASPACLRRRAEKMQEELTASEQARQQARSRIATAPVRN